MKFQQLSQNHSKIRGIAIEEEIWSKILLILG